MAFKAIEITDAKCPVRNCTGTIKADHVHVQQGTGMQMYDGVCTEKESHTYRWFHTEVPTRVMKLPLHWGWSKLCRDARKVGK